MMTYRFKTAETAAELEAVYRLNYRTFVEEIPQHEPNPGRTLVDRFDVENTYLIALHGTELIGMVAVRGNRPFSLDSKLDDFESYLPTHRRLCEIRLLSVESEHRNGQVFWGLMKVLFKHVEENAYDLAVISGTVRQLKLYGNLGFIPFGPQVGTDKARYQPMYLPKETFEARLQHMSAGRGTDPADSLPLNFLPGPVRIRPGVQRAFAASPISHRSASFMKCVGKIKQRLQSLTGAESAEILLGSGTLANDAIAWQLKQLGQPGLVLTCGEFGNRLVDHALRAGLDFQVIKTAANADEPDIDIEALLSHRPDAKWLWTVHCETSTGAMINLPAFRAACLTRGIKLCVDAISTFGLMPVDFRNIYFASAVSGKAVGGYPGLAMVFYSHVVEPARFGIPRYLDLHAYAKNKGIPYTHSSNLMAALDEALVSYPEDVDFEHLTKRAAWLRGELKKMGCNIVSPAASISPAVVTIDLPSRINSEAFGDRLADLGCMLSYQSGYLRTSNRVQICMMSDMKKKSLQNLLSHMRTCM